MGRHAVSFGYAVVRKFPDYPVKSLEKIFQDAKSAYLKIFPFLEGAKIRHGERGSIPINPVSPLVHGNIVLTGDAAALATNWMCMGMEPALWSGRAAAMAVLQALQAEDDGDARLDGYQAQWEEKYGPAYKAMAVFSPSFWAFSDSMWEFIFKYDVQKLKPKQFLERMKHNAHRMKWGTFSRRYLRYRLGKMFSKQGTFL